MQCGLDPDVKVLYEGHSVILFPLTKAGEEWLNANACPMVPAEVGEGTELESERSGGLLTKLLNDGLTYTGC